MFRHIHNRVRYEMGLITIGQLDMRTRLIGSQMQDVNSLTKFYSFTVRDGLRQPWPKGLAL